MSLTAKQKAFAERYVENGYQPLQAYLDAYPNASMATAKTKAYANLKKPEILDYIHLLEKDAFQANCITAERIANELASMAFAAVDNEHGLTYGVKQKALDLLQKQLSLQNQKVDVSGTQTFTINITGDDD